MYYWIIFLPRTIPGCQMLLVICFYRTRCWAGGWLLPLLVFSPLALDLSATASLLQKSKMSHIKRLQRLCHTYDNTLEWLHHTISEQVLLLKQIWPRAMPDNCVSAKSSIMFCVTMFLRVLSTYEILHLAFCLTYSHCVSISDDNA